jgi:membrane associated rhomboid family serine protease
MIFPFLRGILKWTEAPLTWSIFALCVMFYMMTFTIDRAAEESLRSSMDTEFLSVSGYMYYQYLDESGKNKLNPELRERILTGGAEPVLYLGSKALRDQNFLEVYNSFSFKGDQVAIANWKNKMVEHLRNIDKRASQVFGLSYQNQSIWQWITYQFMHGSFMHLLSNMLVFFIFASVIEKLFGSSVLGFIYISGGLMGGLGYLLLNPGVTSPLVGASGAVSALIGFYAFAERHKNVKFLYFISPMQGHFGFVYLPRWVILLICIVPDVSAYFATPDFIFSGVAYTSHIFGALWGLIMALGFKVFSRSKATA